MSVKKKLIIAILIIILLIIIIIFSSFLHVQVNYSSSSVENLINSQPDSSNMYVTEEGTIDGDPIYREIFTIDGSYYVISKSSSTGDMISESFYDAENSELTIVDLENQGIISYSDMPEDQLGFLSENDELLENLDNYQYEYLGRTEINGKECIQIRLTNEDGSIFDNYYINLEDNQIIKHETYEDDYFGGFNKTLDLNYTYTYDTVTDNDLKKFDMDDYPDYSTSTE